MSLSRNSLIVSFLLRKDKNSLNDPGFVEKKIKKCFLHSYFKEKRDMFFVFFENLDFSNFPQVTASQEKKLFYLDFCAKTFFENFVTTRFYCLSQI